MEDQKSQLNRRTVLGRLGATIGTLGIVGSGSTAADDVGTQIECWTESCVSTGEVCSQDPTRYTREVTECCDLGGGHVNCTTYTQCSCPS